MKTSGIQEIPIFSVVKPYDDDDMRIYASDLKAADVGKEWKTQNQACCSDHLCTWTETFKVVYKDDDGVAVLYRCDMVQGRDYYHDDHIELVWVDLH